MLLMNRQIWSAKNATATVTLQSIDSELAHSISLILTVATTAFSGNLDFQGKEHTGDTYTNLVYQEIDVDGGTRAANDDQLSYTVATNRKRYLIPIAPEFVQLVMTRSAGTISAWVRGSGVPIILPMSLRLVSTGDQQITSLSSATNLTVPAGSRRAVVQILTQGVYYTEDSVTPSSTNGLEADAGDTLEYLDADYSGLLGNLEFIEKVASAKLNIAYYD